MIWYTYTLWKDSLHLVNTSITSHIYLFLFVFLLVKTLKFHSFSKFQLNNVVLSTVVTIFYIRSSYVIYPKKIKTGYQRDICTPMLIAALFTIAKIWKQSKCLSMDEWIKKIYMLEYHSDLKKKILPIATTWMDLEGTVLCEMSQRKTNTVW